MNELNVIATARYLDASSIDHVVNEWGLSNKEAAALRVLINYRDEDEKLSVKSLLDLVMVNALTQDEAHLILKFDRNTEGLGEWEAIQFPEFPVRGQDLLDIGLSGKVLGDTLKNMRVAWVLSNYKSTKEELLSVAH